MAPFCSSISVMHEKEYSCSVTSKGTKFLRWIDIRVKVMGNASKIQLVRARHSRKFSAPAQKNARVRAGESALTIQAFRAGADLVDLVSTRKSIGGDEQITRYKLRLAALNSTFRKED